MLTRSHSHYMLMGYKVNHAVALRPAGKWGSAASAACPVWVRSLGLAYTCAPKFSTPALAFRCKCDHAPVRLLVIADLDHVNLQVNVEDAQRARHRQRAPPLPRPGLGRQRLSSGFL